jgi:hypothetical protein
MDDTVEDGVGDGGLTDHLMPTRDGELGGYDRGSALITFLEEFKEVEALLVGQTVGAPIVEDEELDATELVDQPWERPSRRAIAMSSNRRGMRA